MNQRSAAALAQQSAHFDEARADINEAEEAIRDRIGSAADTMTGVSFQHNTAFAVQAYRTAAGIHGMAEGTPNERATLGAMWMENIVQETCKFCYVGGHNVKDCATLKNMTKKVSCSRRHRQLWGVFKCKKSGKAPNYKHQNLQRILAAEGGAGPLRAQRGDALLANHIAVPQYRAPGN